MTTVTKKELLTVFDALTGIANGREIINAHPHSGKGGGGYLACDICGSFGSSSEPHTKECPVGIALNAIRALIPAWNDRDKWLQEPAP